MREFQDRRRMRRLLHSRYAIGILFVVLVLSTDALWGIHDKYQKSEELEQRMQGNLAELQTRKRKLEALNASLATDQGREREIRDRFGVVREGENTVIIFDENSQAATSTPLPPRGWFGWIFDLFR